MRCPRCGAFLDNNKTICFMCGASLNSDNSEIGAQSQNNNVNSGNNQNFDNGFNSVNPFGNSFGNNDMNLKKANGDNFASNRSFNGSNDFSNSGFNNPTVNNFNNNDLNNKIFAKKQEIKINDDYKNIKLEDIKTDKDIFDFFSEHKKGIKLFFTLLLLVGIGFGIFLFVKNKMEPEQKEPLIGNLYYEVDDDFDLIQNSSNTMVYSLTGSKGSDCSISIMNGTTTSGNHVLDFFKENEQKLAPEVDREGNIINQLDVFKTETNEFEINDQLWSRQYFYYKSALNATEYSLLKKIFLTTMYKGYFYDISLVNNSNSTSCNVALDSFVNSLEFVDVEKK